MNALLFITSILYGVATRLRNILYDHGLLFIYHSKLPVVSIGNITAGGNAKTPLCEYVATIYREQGYRPIILSRGYGGTEKGPCVVKETDSPLQVGDEPLLLTRHGFLVVIARDRVAGIRFCEEHGFGDIVILDDGFQHRRLHRDLDVISINVGTEGAIDSFIEGKLLPLGRFREARTHGLERASLVIFSQRGGNPLNDSNRRRLQALLPREIPVYESRVVSQSLVTLHEGALVHYQGEVTAFCGLANPEPFFASLSSAGIIVRDKIVFSDHHHFSDEDIRLLEKRARKLPLVCTEKDAVKLRSRVSLDSSWYVLKISTEVSPRDEFMLSLLTTIRSF